MCYTWKFLRLLVELAGSPAPNSQLGDQRQWFTRTPIRSHGRLPKRCWTFDGLRRDCYIFVCHTSPPCSAHDPVDDVATVSLAVKYLFLTNDGLADHSEATLDSFNANQEQNDYEVRNIFF